MTRTPRCFVVRGDDPVLRDRAVQDVVDRLLDGEDRSFALDDHTIPSPRARSGAGDDGDAGTDAGDEGADGGAALEQPAFAAIVNALQSPPFMTSVRVVVVRDVGHLAADESRWLAEYVADPLDTTRLVLVAGGGRFPAALEKAAKAAGAQTVKPASEDTATVLADEAASAGVRFSAPAAKKAAAHLGEDAARAHELVEVLHAAYGEDSTIDLDDLDAYLGELGTAKPFELANAIDRGDAAGALEVLHRQLRSTSARQPKPMHPLQVMAALVGHYQRLLRLDDPAITTPEQAAEVLGGSAASARFRLDASRRLGSDGLREAFALLARADLDLRGATAVDPETVMEVLVARLSALTKRRMPAGRRR